MGEVFPKSMKWKRISSLIDGFVSGLLSGIALTTLMIGGILSERGFPMNIVTVLLVLIMIAVATFVWGVHSALATREP
jgi:hypothetical protein